MINENGVELKLEHGEEWIRRALEDPTFRSDCYRQLIRNGWEQGVVAYEKKGTFRVGGSLVHAATLLHDTLLEGTYIYQSAHITRKELLK